MPFALRSDLIPATEDLAAGAAARASTARLAPTARPAAALLGLHARDAAVAPPASRERGDDPFGLHLLSGDEVGDSEVEADAGAPGAQAGEEQAEEPDGEDAVGDGEVEAADADEDGGEQPEAAAEDEVGDGEVEAPQEDDDDEVGDGAEGGGTVAASPVASGDGLSGSVGRGGANAPADVERVQQRLADVGLDPGPIDRRVGPRTLAAIAQAQRAIGFARPDELVEPGRRTARALFDPDGLKGVVTVRASDEPTTTTTPTTTTPTTTTPTTTTPTTTTPTTTTPTTRAGATGYRDLAVDDFLDERKGDQSLAAIIIGNAEGNRTTSGGFRGAYRGHYDPGNGKWNVGSFSYQTKQGLTPAAADRAQIKALRGQVPAYVAACKRAKLNPENALILTNYFDLYNQSPKGAGRYLAQLDYLTGAGVSVASIIELRVRCFFDMTTGTRWPGAATGFVNMAKRKHGRTPTNAEVIAVARADQRRRVEAMLGAMNAQGLRGAGTTTNPTTTPTPVATKETSTTTKPTPTPARREAATTQRPDAKGMYQVGGYPSSRPAGTRHVQYTGALTSATIPGLPIDRGVKLAPTMIPALEAIGRHGGQRGIYVTSGVRTDAEQAAIIVRKAGGLIGGDLWKAYQVCRGKGQIVAWVGNSPHRPGKAFDLGGARGGVSVAARRAAVERAKRAAPGAGIGSLIPESANNCLHVNVDA